MTVFPAGSAAKTCVSKPKEKGEEPVSERHVRAAKNESLFREINERIAELNEAFEEILPVSEWICECADQACIEPLPLSLEAYEELREHPARFAVRPGHELLEVERVVEEHPEYLIVEKTGVAQEIAVENDPRSE
jgi:hypothetical protein